MRWLFLTICVASLCGFLAVRPALAADPDPADLDEQLLKDAHVGTTGPALLDFFRKRTITEDERGRVEAVIRRLGDPSFEVRQKASADLFDRGPVVMRQVRAALQDRDAEIAHRAEECLRLLEYAADPSIAAAAARLVGVRKPTGSVEVMLAYVPFATDEMVVDEVRNALAAVALEDGKPDKLLLDTVGDKNPIRRAAAGEALARSAGAEVKRDLHSLLRDPDLTVRQWVAGGLLEGKDREALPVLIALLAELPREQAWRVEDLLYRVAGEQAPGVPLGEEGPERRKCRDAWAKWWDENRDKVDLAKVDLADRPLGYTLVVEMDLRGGVNGKVAELGRDGKPRWQIEKLQYAMDARVLGHDRVLITEYTGRTVSERNFKGEVLWQKQLDNGLFPVSAQRLPNGNTFIVCRNRLLEVDRSGKEVSAIDRPTHDVMSAQKLRTGQLVVCTSTGALQWLDAAGKELRSVATDPVQMFGGGIEVAANGRVLVPQYRNNKVLEFSSEGKKLAEFDVQLPVHASRLPNGHLLAVSMGSPQLVELDQSGKDVWDYKADATRLLKARRR